VVVSLNNKFNAKVTRKKHRSHTKTADDNLPESSSLIFKVSFYSLNAGVKPSLPSCLYCVWWWWHHRLTIIFGHVLYIAMFIHILPNSLFYILGII